MAHPADEARQLVDQRIVQLARLHWTLRSQATRVESAMSWFSTTETPAAVPVAMPPRAPALTPQRLALPAEDPPAAHGTTRRLHIVVSESREVGLEVEDRMDVPASAIGRPRRLAS
jgi:hypothetical protein